MLFRKMKKAEPELSILGFGCMRLPTKDNGQIDEEKATGMLRYAIDHGVNYVDTAYPYHNGESEPVVGRALADGYREKVHLATKLPSWLITSREDMDKYLNEQLVRLRTDHIDFYLVHGLNRLFWENLSALGVTDFLTDALADGRIRYAGFSFHDNATIFREIVKSYDWTFAQIQYNFMDEHYQAGTEGLEYAAKKGLGIVVMEPIRGGLLARDLTGISEIWKKAKVRHQPAEWALRWVWNHPEVTVVLSGMSTPEQVRQNVAFARKRVAGLAHKDRALPVREGEKRTGKADQDPLHRMQVLRTLPARREHPGVLRVLQPWAYVRRRRTDTGDLFNVPRRFLRWHSSLRLALPGVRRMRGEMSPGPPDPREPERSREIFREITGCNGSIFLASTRLSRHVNKESPRYPQYSR